MITAYMCGNVLHILPETLKINPLPADNFKKYKIKHSCKLKIMSYKVKQDAIIQLVIFWLEYNDSDNEFDNDFDNDSGIESKYYHLNTVIASCFTL